MCVAGGRVDATLRGFHKQKRKKKKIKRGESFFQEGFLVFPLCASSSSDARIRRTAASTTLHYSNRREREKERDGRGENRKKRRSKGACHKEHPP